MKPLRNALSALALLAVTAGVVAISVVGRSPQPAEAASLPNVEVLLSAEAMNSAGDHVYATMYVNDATGVVNSVQDAGPIALKGSPLTAGENDGSGCITASTTTGLFTIAARCGVGELKLTACMNDVTSSANALRYGQWQVTPDGGSATAIGPQSVNYQLVLSDAGVPRKSDGCVTYIYDAGQGDKFGFYLTGTTAADTITTRNATIAIEKLLNK